MVNKEAVPVIIIPGFGQSKAGIFDEKGELIKQVWPLRFDLKAMAGRILPPYIKTVLCRKDKGFTDTAYELYTEVFKPFSCNPDGTQKMNLQALEYNTPLSELSDRQRGFVHKLVPINKLGEKIGEENLWFFSYNAFASPFESAQKLNALIETVKAKSGSEQVSLLAYSMGGSVVTAFFSLYPQRQDIKKVFLLCCALSGSVLQADIMRNNIDKKQGYSFLGFITNEETVKSFKKALAFTTWETRYRLLYRSLDAVRDSVFLNSPGMWALMPPEDYPALAKEFISDEAHSELRKITCRFHEAQEKVRDILREQEKRGIEFHVCAGYGLHIMPVSASQHISTDGILPLSSASLGAKAGFGESPDSENLLFRDTTYLYESLSHSGGVKDERIQRLIGDTLC